MGRKRGTEKDGKPVPTARSEYIAAVRYHNGNRELFRVTNANDIDDARSVILDAVADVAALVVARRTKKSGA